MINDLINRLQKCPEYSCSRCTYLCANCDLGLKRSECTDKEYTECECRRWMIKEINQTTLLGFMHLLDKVLETVSENKNDLRNNKARMIEFLSKSIIE